MVRTVITGIGGRMGGVLVRRVQDTLGMVLAGGTVKPGSPWLGQDVGTVVGSKPVGLAAVDSLAALLLSTDKATEKATDRATDRKDDRPVVVIDFTAPAASVAHARLCAERQVPLVIGTTGLEEEAREAVAQAARQTAVVLAPNTSVGVNVVFQMAAELARSLGEGYDVDILEAHHRMKKDAPSGTALKLAEVVAWALGRDATDFTLSRHGQLGARPPREIGVQTLRGGDVVGEHTVYFFGDGERVELTHRATSRDQFARGAVRAAQWLVGRPPGLYDMRDVLGFKR